MQTKTPPVVTNMQQKPHLIVITMVLLLMAVLWFLLSGGEESLPPPPPPVATHVAPKTPPVSPPSPASPLPASVATKPATDKPQVLPLASHPKAPEKATATPTPPPSSPPPVVTTQSAPVTSSMATLDPASTAPLTLVAKKQSPRIDVIGPEGTQMSLQLLFDNQVICTITGKIDAQLHRPFPGGLLAEGVCHSHKTVDQGQHEYGLKGQIRWPDGTTRDVSFTTGPKNVSGVVEPSIEIGSEGEVKIRLAVG